MSAAKHPIADKDSTNAPAIDVGDSNFSDPDKLSFHDNTRW